MSRTTTIAAVIAVLLVGAVFKIGVAPTHTLANTEASGISIYDLHVGHPNMANLPVQEAPLP